MKGLRKIAAWVLCAVALAAVLLQRAALSKAGAENQTLQSESGEAQRLMRENAGIEQLRAEDREIETLRHETRELHKLRNEVRQLREQVKGLPQVQSENQRLKAVVASRTNATTPVATSQSPTTLDQVSYLGTETPEATLQSFFWSIRQEHVQAFRNCLTPERQKEMESLGEEQLRARMKEMKRSFKGFQIVAKREVSANEVQLGLQFYAENQQDQSKFALPFKRLAYEWKLDVTLFH